MPNQTRHASIIDVYTSNRSEAPRPCACSSVRKTARVLARTFDSALAEAGLNITQLAVMRAVLRHPHEPLTRVAEDLAMDRTSLYRALAALEKQRWVRLRNGPDGRTRAAAITAAGEAALRQAEPGWAMTQRALIERFGASQWQTLVAELRRLADCARALENSE
jgi:DNA-binding MarR family transcriptional regulator